jgi:hypothetical protein
MELSARCGISAAGMRSEMRGTVLRGILALCALAIGPVRGAEPVCPPEPLRPLLAFPQWQADGLYFQLEGTWNATYLLQMSTNLHDWTTFSTTGALWRPWIRAPGNQPQTYVRAVLEDPLYPLFNFALRASVGIDSNRIIFVDSYDSSDPRYSTNGEYDPSKAKDGGDLALGIGLEGKHYLGNSDIKGKAFTLGDTSVVLGPNGRIGGTDWTAFGIQPGWATNNLRGTFMPEPVIVPFTTGAVPWRGIGEHSAYEYVLGTGDYQLNILNGDVLVLGNARLLVSSNVIARSIVIFTNASLQIFCAGENAAFGTVSNLAEVSSFQFYGLAPNSLVSFAPRYGLKGLIYAPNAYCQMAVGGADWGELYGACIVRHLSPVHLRIHFDEQLKRFCAP